MEEITKEDLLNELGILKEEYIKLLNDFDVLENWGKPQLEAIYATRVGIYKLKVLEAQIRIKGLKLKIELIRSAKNTNQKIDIDAIELTIAEKLADAYQQVMQQSAHIEGAKAMLRNLETPEKSAELRKIFRQLAKDLHPDANPELTYEQQQIWHLVKDAYQSGDIEKLKALQLVYSSEIKNKQDAAKQITEEQITLHIHTITAAIKLLHDDIRIIKLEFPFTIEDELKNEDWLIDQVQQTEIDLAKLETYENELLAEIQVILL